MSNLENIENKLNKDSFVISEFSGQSMFPLLNQNTDKIVVGKVDKSNVKKLDIVLYKTKNGYILHRVIDIKDNTLIIRGDNMLLKEHVDIDNIYGVLVGYYNTKKYVEITDSINRKYYYLSLISFPFRKIKHMIGNVIRKHE